MCMAMHAHTSMSTHYRSVDGHVYMYVCTVCVYTHVHMHEQSCHANPTCLDSPTNTSCICQQGMYGNGVHCEPDECSMGTHDCPAHSACVKSPGSYSCPCVSGYAAHNGMCVPGLASAACNGATTVTAPARSISSNTPFTLEAWV